MKSINNHNHKLYLKKLIVLAAGLTTALLPQPSRADDPLAYIATGGGDFGFGIVDLANGQYTQIGDTGVALAGLGEVNGEVYAGVQLGGTLFDINTQTSALAPIGTGAIDYQGFGSANNTLYGLGISGGALTLNSVSPQTGQTTLIASTGLSSLGYGSVLSAGGSTLYLGIGTPSGGAELYSLNLSSGAATWIGNTGAMRSFSDPFGALVYENGDLYCAADGPLYSLNENSAAGTFIANVSQTGLGVYDGLAPVPSPEPSALGLVGIGFLAWLGCENRSGGRSLNR